MELFTSVFPSLSVMNEWKNELFVTIPDINGEEYVALMGRYGSSHIRYTNRMQFMCAFFTIMRENQEKLRLKLKVNNRLRTLEENEALSGDEIITNQAANPDTLPPSQDYEPLGFVNAQTAQKGNLGKVKGLYEWKHSVGGQAYNEFLEGFRPLFRVVLSKEEVTVYGQ